MSDPTLRLVPIEVPAWLAPFARWSFDPGYQPGKELAALGISGQPDLCIARHASFMDFAEGPRLYLNYRIFVKSAAAYGGTADPGYVSADNVAPLASMPCRAAVARLSADVGRPIGEVLSVATAELHKPYRGRGIVLRIYSDAAQYAAKHGMAFGPHGCAGGRTSELAARLYETLARHYPHARWRNRVVIWGELRTEIE